MPNWCDNSATLSHEDKSKIDALEAELSKKNDQGYFAGQPLQHLHPNPSGEWDYDWSVKNWGTKWEMDVIDYSRDDDNTITIYFNSAWSPPTSAYDYLVEQGWSVNALYNEPGMGFAGVYENGTDDYYEYDITAKSSIEELPADVIDFGNLLEANREWVINELEDEWAGAERTNWHTNEKPAYDGWYEIQTEGWEFTQFMEFKDGDWDMYDPTKVTKWRGLKENPSEAEVG